MALYAIGDLQGCYRSLLKLLEKIQFDPSQDTLWFVGDLVNRGEHSLEVLRFIRALPHKVCLLGNHDLHLLGVHFGVRALHSKDTLNPILQAQDREELIQFLLQQPLFYWDRKMGYAMTHAGIHPSWSFEEAEKYSEEISTQLKNPDTQALKAFLGQIFGDEPATWTSDLTGLDRARCLINIFTRMRICQPNSSLVLDYKGTYENRPPQTEAWFNLRSWKSDENLIFGHWAALMGNTGLKNVFGIDTGCIWGNELTALKIPATGSGESPVKISIKSES